VDAVVGVSAGGRTAMAMAERHSEFVRRLVLESSVGFVPWPDLRTRLMAYVVFNVVTERATWAGVCALMHRAPTLGFRALLRDLSSEPVDVVLANLDNQQRETLRALFSQMRSGRGFLNDLRRPSGTPAITVPTLVVASRKDGSVAFTHAESLVAGVPHAELVASEADTHFVWFGSDSAQIAKRTSTFLLG
jgi:pimeloyl-ACP methyl ester carboxylesterase